MVRTLCLLPLQGAQVWYLVRELRSLMVQGSGGKESPFHIFSSVHLSHREGWEGQNLTGVLGIEVMFPRELSNMARIIPYVYWPKWNPKPPGCTRVLLPDSIVCHSSVVFPMTFSLPPKQGGLPARNPELSIGQVWLPGHSSKRWFWGWLSGAQPT